MNRKDFGEPTSHTREMVIAYVPSERLVYQGDLLILPSFGNEIPPGNTATREFGERIGSLALRVEKIYGTHGRDGTMEDLRAAANRSTGSSNR